MIDEDLYQQAADELNTDKRRPHIWARACALASDDHDEARFLYTNLRVEELLAERENVKSSSSDPILTEPDTTLALAPIDDAAATDEDLQNGEDEVAEALRDMGLKHPSADTPASFSAPGGVHNPESNDDFLQLDPMDDSSASDTSEIEDPDPELMSDYVPEGNVKLDAELESTLAQEVLPDEGLVGKAYEEELENFKAEHGDTAAFVIADQFDGSTEYDQVTSDVSLDSTTDLNANALDIDAPIDDAKIEASINDDSTTELTAAISQDDLTQANLDVLDAHNNELDEMLEDAHYHPPKPEEPDTEMLWLDEPEEDNSPNSDDKADIEHETAVYADDTRTEELHRQADELGIGDSSEQIDIQSQHVEGELVEDTAFSDSEDSSALAPAAAMGAAAAGTTTLLGASADTQNRQPFDANDVDSAHTSVFKDDLPLDLTRGRDGKQFWVFRRNSEAQAVKSGVSWSALFLTLPFLLYRQLFGTALIYACLWIISLSGLVVCGLAWLDAGANVTPIVQAGTIGFALLAFIGLIYLPFRYANIWRSEKLENRGYELVAITKAKNPGLAIARARRHSVLGE